MSVGPCSTLALVLRKTPYSESSVVVATLSPEFGKLDFLVRGARKIGGKQFPVVDLFRELRVEFRDKEEGLLTPLSLELAADHDRVAARPELFQAACSLSAFVARNTRPHSPARSLYAAFAATLRRYGEGDRNAPWSSLTKLVYLSEEGLLPEHLGQDGLDEAKQRELLRALLAAASGEQSAPALGVPFWKSLCAWIAGLCRLHELE